MPNLDKTGPQGNGPITGRGMGNCEGERKGRGCCGRGYGRGLGRYFGWNKPQTEEEKRLDLEEYKKSLQEELEDVDKEIANMNK